MTTLTFAISRASPFWAHLRWSNMPRVLRCDHIGQPRRNLGHGASDSQQLSGAEKTFSTSRVGLLLLSGRRQSPRVPKGSFKASFHPLCLQASMSLQAAKDAAREWFARGLTLRRTRRVCHGLVCAPGEGLLFVLGPQRQVAPRRGGNQHGPAARAKLCKQLAGHQEYKGA